VMSVLSGRPMFSEDDAVRLAREMFDVDATAHALPSERDRNFRLTTNDGRRFVLKVSNAKERREVLDLQNRALIHLARHHDAESWPEVRAAISGETIAEVECDGRRFLVRLLGWLPGVRLVDVNPHTPELLYSLGRFVGSTDRALESFSHPAAERELKWNMDGGVATVEAYLDQVARAGERALLERFLAHFQRHTQPRLLDLRRSVIHNDGNDYNVLVTPVRPDDPATWRREVTGIIDLGDMVFSYTCSDLAVACAYAMLDKPDPLAVAAQVTRGYHRSYPLTGPEIELLFDLICLRLCMSVAISAQQQSLEPDNRYLAVSEQPAWALLEQLAGTSPRFAHYVLRHACGMSPVPSAGKVRRWIEAHAEEAAPLLPVGFGLGEAPVFDLSVGSPLLAELDDRTDMAELSERLFARMERTGARVGIGRYDEPRGLYTSDAFRVPDRPEPEWRTIHLGLDLFAEPGTPVNAPFAGTVHSLADNATPLDYGPTIILEHELEAGRLRFHTLYAHLERSSLELLTPGMRLEKGARVGTIGAPPVNGGWPPHLHFQIITDLLDRSGEFPGVATVAEREIWLELSPDPNLILRLPTAHFPAEEFDSERIRAVRRQHLGPSLSLSYDEPLNMVRGFMQFLYDDTGRAYLDCVNNVPHVGHCHPRIVAALKRQGALLNTNTRYLYESLARYVDTLCAKLPAPLSVCYLVGSGSEANDLALRLARAHTGRREMIVLDGAYHGNLSSLIEISPYKFDGPGGEGAPAHVHVVATPDVYRGEHRGADAGARYAGHVDRAIGSARGGIAAFIGESLLGCAGQIVLPDGYLAEAYRRVRAAGGICIADEVQVGFGRVGTHFWGFETQDVVPDIVTLGKPIGNGHPLAAVVTTPEIAASFSTGMEYFNTYGGNPVSCEVGLAVLRVIEEEGLQEHARRVGSHLSGGLRKLEEGHTLIGDVRGLGLFLGIELVRDRETLVPAAAQAGYVVNRMKDHGILLSTDGPLHNVIKIKPPLAFNEEDADRLVTTLDRVLSEDPAQP